MRPIEAYLQRLAEGLDSLPASERDECLREMRAHLEEAAAQSDAATREQREAQAIERFGPAEDIARSMSNEMLIGAASRGFHPVSTARALVHAMVGGASWTLLGVLLSLAYVALLLFGAVAIARLWVPSAGLWFHPGGTWTLTFGSVENATEVLGPWLPLYGPVVTVLGWMALNQLVQRVIRLMARRRRRRGR